MAKQLNVNLAMTADTSQAKLQLQQLQRSLTELVNLSNNRAGEGFGITKEIQEASAAAAQLKVQLKAATDVNTGKLDLSKFSQQLDQSGMNLTKYQTQLTALGPAGEKAFAALATSISNADARISNANSALSQFATTLKNTARWQISSSVLHGFMGTIQSAYGYAQDLNKSLNNIRIVTGQSSDQMAAFAEKANKAAQALNTTTTSYTDAALIFYQQGLNGKEVEERTNAVIKMAQVTGDSATEVSSYMTAIWNNFDDGSESLEHYADVITALGASTASSSAEIAAGLEKFASVAETIGLSYNYSTAALATIVANTRQSADTVGTGLRTIFSRLQGLSLGETLDDGTDLNKYSKALKTVGVDILDASGNMKDMDTILTDLAEKWDNLSQAQQTALAQTVGGVRQYTNLIALMNNWDDMEANLQTAAGSEGSLQDQADIYAESWEAAQKRVRASAEAIYNALLKDDFFIDLNNGFSGFLDIINNTIKGLGGLKGVLLTVGTIITQVYQKEISGMISSLGTQLMMLTKTGKQHVENLRREANEKLIYNAYNDGTTAGAAKAAGYTAQGAAQQAFLDNAKKMSEEQRNIAQILLDQNKALSEAVIKQGELAKETEKEAVSQKRIFELKTGLGRSDKKGAIDDATNKAKRAGRLANADKALASSAESINFDNLNDPRNKSAIKELQASISSLQRGYQDLGMTAKEALGEKAGSALNRMASAFDKDGNLIKSKVEELRQGWAQWTEAFSQGDTNYETALNNLAGAMSGVSAKSIELGTATKAEVAKFNECKEKAREMTQQFYQTGQAESDMAGKTGELSNYVDGLKKKFNEMSQGSIGMSTALTQISSTLMSAGMAINSVIGLIQVWKDEDADLTKKLLTTLTTLGMIVPTIMSVVKGFETAGQAVTIFGIKTSLAMWQVTLIVAAIAGLITILAILSNAESDEEREARRAAETQKALKEAVDETTEAYENLSDAFSDYKDLVTALEACTKGTEEWATKMGEVQQKIESIIEEFPQLIALTNLYNDDGTFNLDTIENYIDNLEKYSRVARVASAMNSAQETETKREEATTTQNRKDISEIVNGYANADNFMSGSYTAGGSTWAASDRTILNKMITQMIEDGIDISTLTAEDIRARAEAQFKAGVVPGTAIATTAGEDRQQHSTFGMTDDQADDLLAYLQTELPTLEETIEENAEENEVGKADRNTALMAANMVLEADATTLERNYAATAFQEAYDSTYQDWLTKGQAWGQSEEQNDEVRQMWKEFQAATGTDYELAKNAIQGGSNNRQIAYTVTKEDGSTEEKTYTLEYVAQMIASSKALEAIGTSGERVATILNDVSTSAVQVAQANGASAEAAQQVAQGLLGFMTGDGKGNLEGLTEEGYAALQTDVANAGSVEAYLKAAFNTEDLETLAKDLGYESAEKLIAGFQSSYDNYAIALDDIVNHLYSSAKEAFTGLQDNMGQLTLAQKRNIAEILNQAYIYGDKAGVELVSSLMKGLSGADLAAFADAIGGVVDWSTMDIATLNKILDDAGITTEFTTAELQALIDAMSDVTMTAEKAASEFAKLHKIIDGIKTGDIISQEDYLTLGVGYEDYFMKMADGTYKLIGDAEEFYNAVNGQSINNFVDAVAEAQNTYDNLLTYKNSGASLEDSGLTQSSAVPKMAYDNWDTNHEYGYATNVVESFDPGLAQAQIEYLQTVAGYSKEQTATWQDMIDTQTMTVTSAQELADEVAKNATQWGNLDQAVLGAQADLQAAQEQLASTCTTFEELDELLRSGQISAEAYTKAFESLSNAEMTEGLDLDALEDYADYLEDLNPELKKYEGQSKKVAASIMKMNDGVDALAKGFEDWSDILLNSTEGSEEYCEALSDMKDALSDLTGVSDDYISRDFIINHMEDIEKAATGDADAIDRLKRALADEIVAKIILDNELTPEKAQEVLDAYNALQVPDVEVGVTLTGDDEFIARLNEMILAAGMTAPQVNELLSGMGFSASFASEPQAVQVKEPDIVTTHHKIANYSETVTPDGRTIPEWDDITTTTTTPGAVHEGEVDAYALETSAPGTTVTPKIDSLTRTARGSSNNYSSSNSGGTSPGKGGGGGGGSSSTPKYNEEKHKNIDDEKERYHVIKNQLEDLTSQYDNISKAKDKAFGAARLANLNKEISAQKKLTQANKEYLKEIESYLSKDKAAVMALGANIDENGTITNYDALIQKAVNDYNAAVDAFNRATTDDEGAKKAFEAAQERYEQFMETISQYEETQDLYKDQMQQVLDDIMTEQSLLLERTQLEVELKLNVSEDALNYLEYMMDNIENKAYDCAEAFGYLNGMTQEYFKTAEALEGGLRSLFANQGLTDTDFQKLIEGDTATYNKLMDMLSSGGTADLSDGLQQSEIDAAYGFTADDVDTMRDYVSQLIEANQNLQEIRQTVHEQILNVWDEWNEKLDAGIAKIEHLQSITESYQNIIDIVGQKNLGVSNAFMSKMRQQSIDQANDKLEAEKARYESLKKARDDAYAKFEEQKAKGILSPEEIKQWEDSLAQMDEDVQSASEDFQSAWEDALTAANEAFEAAVDQIMQAYDDAAAGLMGSMSDLQDAFDRKSDLSSQYLADYEKIYQLTKLNRDLENSIDSTNNTKAKAELLELQSKINAYEEAGIDISEYQMEQLRQEYELKKAQIELEESQEAKSQVQMTRDADGNYSYVYTANADDVANAEQNYEDKLHQMQESNANYINDLQSNMIQMEQDYQDKVQEIMKDTSLTAEERMVKLNELNEYYDEKMKFYMSETELWEENSQRLYEEDWMNYAAATGYKISSEEEWLDHWNETQLSILTGFGSLEEYQTNHNMNVANLLLASSDAFATWQTNIETAMQNAGTSMGTFQEDATEVLDTVAEESEETKDSVVDMAETAADKIGEVVEAVVNWENQYSATVQKMLTWNNALITSFNRLIAGWSAVQSSANSSGAGSGDGSSSGSGSGSGSGSSSSNNGSNSGSSGGGSVDNSDKVAGVAAAIWMDGASASGWGNNPTRATRLKEKGVEGAQAYINAHGANGDIYADWANKRNQLRNYYYGSFDTGGYTGEWGLDGKFAMLHEKELVLNKDDTTHFLQAIDIVRQISELIDLNALSSAGGLSSLLAATASSSSQKLEQQVTIHAEFPNVTDKDQITEAFTDLVNLASQYANRK